MAALRALPAVIAMALAGCSTAPTPTSSPIAATTAAATAAATPTGPPASGTPSPSTVPSPSPGVDPATSLQIAPPYDLVEPSASDLELLSGNIRGLASDLAGAAGADFEPTDFPLGFRFVNEGDKSVGVIVVLGMPAGVADLPGLLEAVAPPVAAEVNALLSYETIDGVKVAILKGPIASTLAIVDGNLIMAQSGQPAVAPKDLMAAVIGADGGG